ncbi:hypothetical protein AVEN_11131-1 [Araneus ventricosus]|uniref:Uncharacterized protein n=1 Tax=Araneus ventricosus TaxID=182803 RepID=A0A4Y2JHM2_ARAVE|nr:hypothetical protein AVEN_11131-1 [Araneus ventricosus]
MGSKDTLTSSFSAETPSGIQPRRVTITEPNMVYHYVTELYLVQLNIAESNKVHHDVTETYLVHHYVTEPYLVQLNIAESNMVHQYVTEPYLVQLNITEPKMVHRREMFKSSIAFNLFSRAGNCWIIC